MITLKNSLLFLLLFSLVGCSNYVPEEDRISDTYHFETADMSNFKTDEEFIFEGNGTLKFSPDEIVMNMRGSERDSLYEVIPIRSVTYDDNEPEQLEYHTKFGTFFVDIIDNDIKYVWLFNGATQESTYFGDMERLKKLN